MPLLDTLRRIEVLTQELFSLMGEEREPTADEARVVRRHLDEHATAARIDERERYEQERDLWHRERDHLRIEIDQLHVLLNAMRSKMSPLREELTRAREQMAALQDQLRAAGIVEPPEEP